MEEEAATVPASGSKGARSVAIVVAVFRSAVLSWERQDIRKPSKTQAGRPVWKPRARQVTRGPHTVPHLRAVAFDAVDKKLRTF